MTTAHHPWLLTLAGLPPDLAEPRAATLRRELADLPGPAADAAPAGAKGLGEWLTLGALALGVAPEAVTAVLSLLTDWLRRNPGVIIRVSSGHDSIELSGEGLGEGAELEALVGRLRALLQAPPAP